LSFNVLQGLAFLVVLYFDRFLFGSDASDLVLGVTDQLLALIAKAFLVTLDGLIKLARQLSNPLLLELQLLALQGLVSFELDLLLGELIKSLGVLESHSLDLFIHFVLLLASLLTVLLKLLVFLAHLLSKSLFLVLKGGYLTLFPR
jgi:hypothetical protein